MAYENYSYDIKERLPEWWKQDSFLEPLNRYNQQLIHDLIGALLGSFGVVQPFQVWKTLPTEYSWTHTYLPHDPLLINKNGGTVPLELRSNYSIIAKLPNSKRNCHGVIQLQLQGDEQGKQKALKKLTIKNAGQQITFHDITTTTDIKIFTEDNIILIDGVQRDDLVVGRFDKIYAQAQNTDYDTLDIYDENKITYLEISSDSVNQGSSINFELQVKLTHPVYVTEQNIRVHTVSAFPIEWIKLYGFFCHEFNNKQEWRFLWEKHYKKKDRVVYDRITKQFDCETFYVQIKLYGIGVPYVYGFPQETLATNAAFQTNSNLDKWGKIYGLPRRFYKTRISEEDERYTYPPFYNYSIEQDYWYEERLVNEYRHNDDAVNAAFIKDSELNNIAILQCIDPFIEDIYVYTETIKKETDYSSQTHEIFPTALDEEGQGVTWRNPHEASNLKTTATEVVLQPQNSDSFNEKQNQTKILNVFFDDIPTLPKNVKIKGLELQLHGLTDIYSDSLILDDRSQMLLPTFYTKKNGEVFEKIDNIQINNEIQYWEKGKGVYKIGGPNDLFNLPEIKRSQIQNGINFNLGFTNLNTFLKATIVLYSIQLIIYYESIYDSYEIDVELDRKEIVLNDPQKQEINMKIHLKNTGEIPVVNKNIYIASAKGIDVTRKTFPTFDLDVGEDDFVIGEQDFDKITIVPTQYEFLSLSPNAVISKTINVKENDLINVYYRTDNNSQMNVSISSPSFSQFHIDSLNIKDLKFDNNAWKKYGYRFFQSEIEKQISTQLEEEITFTEDIQTITITVKNTGNTKLYIKHPSQWTYHSGVTTKRGIKTGFYDLVVFCDEKSIKNEIVVREGLI